MTFTQTRRSFRSMTAVAGAAGLLSPRRGWAEEPALETASVRFGKARTPTPSGGNTTPKTRYAFMHCGCMSSA